MIFWMFTTQIWIFFSGWLWCWWCLRSFLRWSGPKVGWMALYQLEIDPAVALVVLTKCWNGHWTSELPQAVQMKSSVQQIREERLILVWCFIFWVVKLVCHCARAMAREWLTPMPAKLRWCGCVQCPENVESGSIKNALEIAGFPECQSCGLSGNLWGESFRSTGSTRGGPCKKLRLRLLRHQKFHTEKVSCPTHKDLNRLR